jgi:hypothetical protein
VPEWAGGIIAGLKPPPSRPGVVVVGRHRRWTEGQPPDAPREWINRKGMTEFTVKCVCDKCNSGWMSDIEGKAQASLTPMFLDQSVVLDSANQNAIATWLGLKAVVAQYAVMPRRANHEWADAYWRDKSPPGTWHIRIGRYAGVQPVTMGVSAVDFTVIHSLSPITLKRQGFLFTISVGAFVGQVVGITQLTPIATNRLYLTQIWPHPLLRTQSPTLADFGPQNWPPERGFDDANLKKCSQDVTEPK